VALAARTDGRRLTWELRHWVNDALMTIFFLVIGLEVKRGLIVGRLRDPRRARLPIVAALARAAVSALVFLAFNPSGPAARGWAIPMATDPPSPSECWPCWAPGSPPGPRRSCSR
jgi:NhaA family Na+:H+ antiporter